MYDLSEEIITGVSRTRRLGKPALYFASIGSTNDVAKQRAAEEAPEGLLVVADEQTAGRGRGTRSWWAPAGSSLLMSLLLRPPLPPAQAQQATMCVGLGAVEGIARATGLRARLKWPNDLLLNGRKLAGMLTEMDAAGEVLKWVVIGLGINVNVTFRPETTEVVTVPGETTPFPASPVLGKDVTPDRSGGSSRSPGGAEAPPPSDVAGLAISLSMALGRSVERGGLLAAILEATEGWYDRLLAGESPHAAWAAHVDTIGRTVDVTLPDRVLRGVATGVNAQGALLVRDEAGQIHTVWAGDVTTTRAR